MTTIHVSDEVNDRIEAIQDDGGHKSKDSALREALNAHDTVAELEAHSTIPWDTDVLRAYAELGLHHARPVPDAALPAGIGDEWHEAFVLFLAGSWLQNERLANNPPAVSVLYADEGFLFEYRAEPHRYIDTDSPDDIAPPGTYHFAVDADEYENDLLNLLTRSRARQLLAPAGGVPAAFETDDRQRPTFGGWGRTLTADQAAELFDLPTVETATTDATIDHDDWGIASDVVAPRDDDREETESQLKRLANPLQ